LGDRFRVVGIHCRHHIYKIPVPCVRSPGLSENPLLPHSKLRELHALMVRCRSLEQKHTSRGPVREALLAATLIHLLPGDLLSASVGDRVVERLAPEGKQKRPAGSLLSGASLGARLPICAAAARGLQAAGADGVVLAFAGAGGPERSWMEALKWAQTSQLPLVLACSDATNGAPSGSRKSTEPAIDFSSMSRFARRHQLPVLTVDGEDAVAVYRVMQESVLRARQGGGPSVLWAVMTPVRAIATMPRSSQPIARLRSYLAARKISVRP
jgi:transketolase N-terminal domain/subunit